MTIHRELIHGESGKQDVVVVAIVRSAVGLCCRALPSSIPSGVPAKQPAEDEPMLQHQQLSQHEDGAVWLALLSISPICANLCGVDLAVNTVSISSISSTNYPYIYNPQSFNTSRQHSSFTILSAIYNHNTYIKG